MHGASLFGVLDLRDGAVVSHRMKSSATYGMYAKSQFGVRKRHWLTSSSTLYGSSQDRPPLTAATTHAELRSSCKLVTYALDDIGADPIEALRDEAAILPFGQWSGLGSGERVNLTAGKGSRLVLSF